MSTRTETPTARPVVEGVNGARILIVESRYYVDIADALIEGAEREIKMNGALSERVVVPGAFEIPGAIALAAERYDGFVALGCVVRGETTHYDYICGESARALMDLAVHKKLAIGYGILTVDTIEQAKARAFIERGDKGGDAAHACLVMTALRRRWLSRTAGVSPAHEGGPEARGPT